MAVTWTQVGFRGRNDDGTETTATFIAAVNTNWTQLTGVNAAFSLKRYTTGTFFVGISAMIALSLLSLFVK